MHGTDNNRWTVGVTERTPRDGKRRSQDGQRLQWRDEIKELARVGTSRMTKGRKN